MKIRIFAFAAIAVLLLAACDDGRIYNEVAVDTTGRSARLTATITGLDHWTDNYTVSLAGFAEGDDYASISKAVQANADGQVSMTLNNIPDQVTSVRLCVLDRLRRNVVTFSEVATEGMRDTIRLELGTVDACMLNAPCLAPWPAAGPGRTSSWTLPLTGWSTARTAAPMLR